MRRLKCLLLMFAILFAYLPNTINAANSYQLTVDIQNFTDTNKSVTISGIKTASNYSDYNANNELNLKVYRITIDSNYDRLDLVNNNSGLWGQKELQKSVKAVNTRLSQIIKDEYSFTGLTNDEKSSILSLAEQGEYDYYIAIYGKVTTTGSGRNAKTEASEPAILIIQWQKAGGADKSALENALNAVPTTGYYKTEDNDKWNGKEYSTKGGFWAEMQFSKSVALEILNNENATQDEVNNAITSLLGTINRLIPSTQINATNLYEAVNETYYWWDNNLIPSSQLTNLSDKEEACLRNCTTTSWQSFEEAINAANGELAKLFDEDGNATDYNQSGGETVTEAETAISTALTRLEQAVNGLDHIGDSNDLTNAQFAFKQLTILSRRLFNTSAMTTDDYSEESWSAFRTEATAAAGFLANHNTPDAPIGKREVQEYWDAYTAFWRACFTGLKGKTSGNAVIHIVDNHALRNGGNAYGKTGVYSIDVPAGGISLGNALKSTIGADYSFPWDEAGRGVGVYLNGVYLFYPINSVVNRPDSSPLAYQDVMLKDGDTVLIALTTLPTGANASGSVTLNPYSEIHDSLRYICLSQNGADISETSAIAGNALEITANTICSSLMDYSGSTTPLTGAKVYISEAFASREAALAASANQDTGIVTGSDGSFSITLFSTEGSEDGWYILNLLAQGENAGLVNGINLLIHITDPDDLYALKLDLKQQLEQVYTAYDEDFYTETQLSQIQAFYEAGVSGIERATTSGDAHAAFDTAYEGITAIQSANEQATEFNLSAVRELLGYLPSAEDLEAGKLYNVDKPVLDLLFGTEGWYTRMTEYQKSSLSASETTVLAALESAYAQSSSGNSLPEIPAFTVKVEVRDADTGELVDLPLKNDGNYSYVSVNFFNEQTGHFRWQYSATNSLTGGEVGAYLLPIEGNYVVELNIGVDCDDSSVYDYNRWAAESFASNIPEYYLFDNSSVTLFHTLRQDVTIIRYVHRVNPLEAERESAISALEKAYQGYAKTDYTAENWNILEAAYTAGLNAINAAETIEEINTAKDDAVQKMKRVEKKSASEYGSVTVTVRNDTYRVADGAPWEGELVNKTVDLKADSTMMSCIVEALNGYEVIGAANNYISSIFNLAEFDGGKKAGWMGTLNDWFTNEGFTAFSVANGKLHDGDEICVEYTCALGLDIRGGTEGNTDTTLYALSLTDGTLTPSFKSSTTEYVFVLNNGVIETTISFTNNNRAFQSRAYLNNYTPTSKNWISSGDIIAVSGGDVITMGVGESVWPAMGKGVPTKYQITVVSPDDASAVVKLISAIGSVTYSNYKDKQAAVEMAKTAYEALTDDVKAKVGNYSTLTKAEALIEGYQNVGALKESIAALPKIIEDTKDVHDTVTDYVALKDLGLDSLLTIAEINKIELAAELLDILDAFKDTDFTTAEAYDRGALNEALVKWLNDMKIADSVSVSVDSYNDAVSGKEGSDGSYSATVTLRKGKGTAKKTVSGAITRSSDTGVSEIVVNKTTRATGSGTVWSAVMPYGSDPAAAQFSVTLSDKTAGASAPATADGGKTWTFTVTAEDGSTADYTVTLTVSEVKVTVLDSNVYDVSDDTVVTSLSPVGVSGLDAIVADDLDLPVGTKEASVWLMLRIKEQSGDELTLTVTAWYAADGKDSEKISDEKLKDVKLTVTVPLAGTEYAKVRFGSEYLKDTKGSADGIEFPVTGAGDYTLIPDASLVKVTFHLNGGTSTAVTDGQQIAYFPEDVTKALPLATREGAYSFEGWFKSADGSGEAYTKISADLPADLYAVWKSLEEDVEVIEYIDKNKVSVDSVLEDDGTAVVTVKSAEPCVVILKDGDSYVPLKAVKDGDSYVFSRKDYEDSMVFIVAAKGDFDKDGDLDLNDFTAANKAILNSEKIDTLQLLVMGANGKKLKTVDLAKLYLALASGKVEW